MNSSFNISVINGNRYVTFDGLNTHPDVLDAKDLSSLIASDKLWARKFDEYYDSQILEQLGQRLKTQVQFFFVFVQQSHFEIKIIS